MNLKDYISSGIIESYVLGLATAEERLEFEKLCLQYPELVEARNSFEVDLEKELNRGDSVNIPGLKSSIMDAIRPANLPQTEIQPARVRTITSPLRWVAAASVILLLASSFFAYQFYSKNKELELANRDLQARVREADSAVARQQEETKLMKDPNVMVVSMVSTEKSKASANVYWDSTNSNVFLVVKNMPRLPSDKQYQLWALINGQPKDLGLFDVKDSDGGRMMLKMNNTQEADAFAITIENRGNGSVPQGPVETLGKVRL